MTPEELEIAKAACCVGTIWDEYEGKENFDHMVGLRVKHLIELVQNYHQPSLPSNLDEAAEEYADGENPTCPCEECLIKTFKAGAEWMAGQGWHDVTETPSIFGFYLVIHEKGWCVANYMGKGVVCESGWVEAINHIEIEHPQKWLDLRDLIPKKQ